MSELSAQRIVETIKGLGITHVVGLPDNGSRALYAVLDQDPEVEVVGVTREGEAFAVAAGLYAGGVEPLVLVQNTGLFESGDAFRGTLFNMAFPVPLLIGYRGFESLGREPGRVDTAAQFLEPTLKAWEIPYWMLHTDADFGVFEKAFTAARTERRPTAILFPGETH